MVDGQPVRLHYQQVERSTRKRVPELHPEPLPSAVEHVWHWFLQLHSARGAGAASPNPISWQELAAWATMSEAKPTAWEISALRMLDGLYMAEAAKRAAERAREQESRNRG